MRGIDLIVETMRKAGRLAANVVLEEYRNGTPFFHIETSQTKNRYLKL